MALGGADLTGQESSVPATKHGRLPILGALSYLAPLLSTLLLIWAGEAQASVQVLAAAILIIGGDVMATGLLRQGSTAATR